jgi:hypothetical protein
MIQFERSRMLSSVRWVKGSITSFSSLLVLIAVISVLAQEKDYWANALAGKTKIFTISFMDEQNGIAKSAEEDTLTTTDGGKSWIVYKQMIFDSDKVTSQFLWKADVYCSIMKTTDGGNTWSPYEEEKQEHFCGVYLKDVNTGYKVASDFLNKVTYEIITCSENNNLDSLVNHPRKCTEYYRNADEGWTLGWCVKDFSQNKNR